MGISSKQSTQNFPKNEHFLPLIRTHTEEHVRTFLTPDTHTFGEEEFVYFHNTAWSIMVSIVVEKVKQRKNFYK